MTVIGFIGSGNIGQVLARQVIAAGYDVVMSNSRRAETLAPLVAALGPKARAATSDHAATAGDLVVVAIPFRNVAQVPVQPLAGKVRHRRQQLLPATRRPPRGHRQRRQNLERNPRRAPANVQDRQSVQRHNGHSHRRARHPTRHATPTRDPDRRRRRAGQANRRGAHRPDRIRHRRRRLSGRRTPHRIDGRLGSCPRRRCATHADRHARTQIGTDPECRQQIGGPHGAHGH